MGATREEIVVTKVCCQTNEMDSLKHGNINANGIDIHFVEQGEGPLVVFCHGFPESWYSWRHQIPAVASAGFRAVALDMRGYGQTSKPEAISAYSLSHLVGDVVGAVAKLGHETAIIVGHDWGGPVAWNCALMRPDIFQAVAVLSVPFNPPTAIPDGIDLNDLMAVSAGDRDYYRLYFQEPGVAEAEMDKDVRHSMLGLMYSISGDIIKDGVHSEGWDGHFPKGESFVSQLVIPDELPPWLSEQDLQFYIDELSNSGFRGGINWYRNIKLIPGILAPFIGARICQPVLYLYGEYDRIAGNTKKAIETMPESLPNITDITKIQGAGHWLQQERPTEVNSAILAFLASL